MANQDNKHTSGHKDADHNKKDHKDSHGKDHKDSHGKDDKHGKK